MRAGGATGLVLMLAFVAAVVAFKLEWNPCIAFASVAIVGTVLICAAIIHNTRRELAENRERLMRAAQMCPKCGYTIRAKTDRCPECGAPVEG